MANILPIIQLVLSVVLIGLILLQRPVVDAGIMSSSDSGSNHVKRGLEKTVHQLTIIITLIFIATALASLVF